MPIRISSPCRLAAVLLEPSILPRKLRHGLALAIPSQGHMCLHIMHVWFMIYSWCIHICTCPLYISEVHATCVCFASFEDATHLFKVFFGLQLALLGASRTAICIWVKIPWLMFKIIQTNETGLSTTNWVGDQLFYMASSTDWWLLQVMDCRSLVSAVCIGIGGNSLWPVLTPLVVTDCRWFCFRS